VGPHRRQHRPQPRLRRAPCSRTRDIYGDPAGASPKG
jgi:hypothetical protein